MYLESIFIGGDIRSQLPEEARKFDNIHKSFKEVSFASTCFNYPPPTYLHVVSLPHTNMSCVDNE